MENPEAVTDSVNDAVTKALLEKIERLEAANAALKARLDSIATTNRIDLMLGQLRLHEGVLVYIGEDPGDFERFVKQHFGRDGLRHLFWLDQLPLSAEVRMAVRECLKGGYVHDAAANS